MAQKRMFDKSVVRRDDFLEMSISSQNLYFHLSMDADDDGFVDNWKSIIKITGAKEDDMINLVNRKFVLPFDSGILVIRHWRLNNYLRKDRYTETKYLNEKSKLITSENEEYYFKEDNMVYQVATSGIHSIEEKREDKNSIVENSIDNTKPKKSKYGEYKNVLLTEEELQSLKSSYDNADELIKYLDEYIEMKGYKAKSHYLCIKKWVIDAVKGNNKNTINTEPKKYSKEWWDNLGKGDKKDE